MTRDEALQILATDHGYAQMTAHEAIHSLTQAFQRALESRDLAFFEFHGEDPCIEVARACRAGHVWHPTESCTTGEPPRKPRWHALEQEVVPQVIRKT
jgi:hypothetical protein